MADQPIGINKIYFNTATTSGNLDASSSTDYSRETETSLNVPNVFVSASNLTRVAGRTICEFLNSSGITDQAVFSTDSTEVSTLTVNSEAVHTSNRLISVTKVSDDYVFACEGRQVQVSRVSSIYVDFAFKLYLLASEGQIEVMNVIPKEASTFDLGKADLGKADLPFRNLFADNATLDTLKLGASSLGSSGYITLPGNLLLQWKKMTNIGNWNGGDYDPTTCTFPVSFSATPYYCNVTIINPTVTRDNYFYGYLYDGTKTTQHSGIALSKSYCVFAAHKDFTGALIIAIGKA